MKPLASIIYLTLTVFVFGTTVYCSNANASDVDVLKCFNKPESCMSDNQPGRNQNRSGINSERDRNEEERTYNKRGSQYGRGDQNAYPKSKSQLEQGNVSLNTCPNSEETQVETVQAKEFIFPNQSYRQIRKRVLRNGFIEAFGIVNPSQIRIEDKFKISSKDDGRGRGNTSAKMESEEFERVLGVIKSYRILSENRESFGDQIMLSMNLRVEVCIIKPGDQQTIMAIGTVLGTRRTACHKCREILLSVFPSEPQKFILRAENSKGVYNDVSIEGHVSQLKAVTRVEEVSRIGEEIIGGLVLGILGGLAQRRGYSQTYLMPNYNRQRAPAEKREITKVTVYLRLQARMRSTAQVFSKMTTLSRDMEEGEDKKIVAWELVELGFSQMAQDVFGEIKNSVSGGYQLVGQDAFKQDEYTD